MADLHLPDLLADVYEEVAQHLDIGESAADLVAALHRWLPITGLVVRRWDVERGNITTVAVAGVQVPLGMPIAIASPRRDALLAWGLHGRPEAWLSRGETSLGRLVVPRRSRGRSRHSRSSRTPSSSACSCWSGISVRTCRS
jgi:hypothetical protein